jgi:RES domain-containing protein
MRSIQRSGPYSRVADPTWSDPLDTSYSALAGGRWNAVGVAALYLNANDRAALANARRLVAAFWSATLEDVRPDRLPDLLRVNVAPGTFLDAVTAAGIAELGFGPAYPAAAPRSQCQESGAVAREAGLDGVAALSAVAPSEEELAIWGERVLALVTPGERLRFSRWA